jgi:hypothetical protein
MNQLAGSLRRQFTSPEVGGDRSPVSLQTHVASDRSTTMAEHSRRAFIRGAGATAAAATVAVMVPGVAGAATRSEKDDGGPTPDGSVVAFVKDAKAGTVTVMRGEHEVHVTDKALARKLAKLSQS